MVTLYSSCLIILIYVVSGITEIITNSSGIKEGGVRTLMRSQLRTFLLLSSRTYDTDFEGSSNEQSEEFWFLMTSQIGHAKTALQ